MVTNATRAGSSKAKAKTTATSRKPARPDKPAPLARPAKPSKTAKSATTTKAQAFDFDLYVIGGGSGGVRAARMAAQRGARVGLAECAELGGTCVNVGCIPKKLYSYAAGYGEAFEEAAGYGWQVGKPRFDWARLKANRAKEIHRLNAVYDGMLEAAGVSMMRGYAQVVDGHTVRIDDKTFTAKYILIATGGLPYVPDVAGRELVVVSDNMFDIDPFPKRLVIVGGGYIACEMASIFNGLGSKVTLLQRNAHILNGFDEDVREFLAKELVRSGIDLRVNAEIDMVSRLKNGDLCALLSRGQRIEADAVLYATGRTPNTAGLGLEAAGVALDAHGGVIVDADYRSSVRSILAVGDVSSRQQLTPIALAEGMAVVDQLFPGDRKKPPRTLDYEFTPTAVFTHPNIGTCGYTEAGARMKFGKVVVYGSEFRTLRHTMSGSKERTFMKMIVDPASDRVVGIHMVGPDAGEIIQGFAVAMRAGATKTVFDNTIGIHPTVAEEFVTMREPMPG